MESRATTPTLLSASLGAVLLTLLVTGSLKTHWGDPESSIPVLQPLPKLVPEQDPETRAGLESRATALIQDLLADAEILSMEVFPAGGIQAQVKTGSIVGRVVVMPDGEHLVIGKWYSRQGPMQAPGPYLGSIPPAAEALKPEEPLAADNRPDLGEPFAFDWSLDQIGDEPRHWALNYPPEIASIDSEEDLLQHLEGYPTITQGDGPNIVFMFYDALCHVCQAEYELISSNGSILAEEGIQIRWLPIVRFVGESYEKAAFHLAAMAADAANEDPVAATELLDKLLSPGTVVDDLLADYHLTESGKFNVQMATRTFFRVIEAMPNTAPGRGTPLSVFRNLKGEAIIRGGKLDLQDLREVGPLNKG